MYVGGNRRWVPLILLILATPIPLRVWLYSSCDFVASETQPFHFYIRDFKIHRRGRQRERQKNNWSNKQNTTLHVHHVFLHIYFLFLHDYDVKMPNFSFYGGRKQATTKFYFSF